MCFFPPLQLKLVSMMEKVIILERKLPDLVDRQRVDTVEQTLTALQQRLTQGREGQQLQQGGSGAGGVVAVGGNARVGRYGTVENMAGG